MSSAITQSVLLFPLTEHRHAAGLCANASYTDDQNEEDKQNPPQQFCAPHGFAFSNSGEVADIIGKVGQCNELEDWKENNGTSNEEAALECPAVVADFYKKFTDCDTCGQTVSELMMKRIECEGKETIQGCGVDMAKLQAPAPAPVPLSTGDPGDKSSSPESSMLDGQGTDPPSEVQVIPKDGNLDFEAEPRIENDSSSAPNSAATLLSTLLPVAVMMLACSYQHM